MRDCGWSRRTAVLSIMLNMPTIAGLRMPVAAKRITKNYLPSGTCRKKNLSRNDFDPERPCTLRRFARGSFPRFTFLISTFNRRSILLNTLQKLKSLEDSEDISARKRWWWITPARTEPPTPSPRSFPALRPVAWQKRESRRGCAKNAGLAAAPANILFSLMMIQYPRRPFGSPDDRAFSTMIRSLGPQCLT